MTVVKQHELLEQLVRAKHKARLTATKMLVSHRVQVDTIDPLVVFQNSERLFHGKRSYWSDSTNKIQLVGIGEAIKLEVDGKARFSEIKKRWQTIIDRQFVDSSLAHIPGTGPVLLGGFSFDPKKSKTPLWTNYADASFVLPEYTFTFTNQQAYITMNMFVGPDDDIQKLFSKGVREQVELISAGKLNLVPASSFSITEIEPEQWKQTVQDIKAMIQKSDIDKVVLAREVIIQAKKLSALTILANLREQQTQSFLFAIERGNKCFIGASPERLVQKQNGTLLSTCLAGSSRRGNFTEEDDKLGNLLLSDNKNREEHAFVVRMIQDALEDVAGTVHIPSEPTLYKGRNIQHLYTPVIVKNAADVSLLDVLQRLHPTPALGGFPQQQSVEIIRKQERLDRGWYSGPVGWIDYKNQGEFAVAIRSGLIADDHASLFAGCGIVADSNPENEYEETQIKLKPMLSAIGGYNNGA